MRRTGGTTWTNRQERVDGFSESECIQADFVYVALHVSCTAGGLTSLRPLVLWTRVCFCS